MSWLSSAVDFISGNPNSGKMNSILNKNMGQYTSGLQGMSGQMQDMANQSFDFNSGMNQMQRGLLQNQAQDATATGALQAQRMAAQQGMGGSGLLQQATANQAYSNLSKAGIQGLQAFGNQQRLGQGFLNSSANILNQAGEIQSNLNTGMANVEADKAANRGKLARGAIGLIAGAY